MNLFANMAGNSNSHTRILIKSEKQSLQGSGWMIEKACRRRRWLVVMMMSWLQVAKYNSHSTSFVPAVISGLIDRKDSQCADDWLVRFISSSHFHPAHSIIIIISFIIITSSTYYECAHFISVNIYEPGWIFLLWRGEWGRSGSLASHRNCCFAYVYTAVISQPTCFHHNMWGMYFFVLIIRIRN